MFLSNNSGWAFHQKSGSIIKSWFLDNVKKRRLVVGFKRVCGKNNKGRVSTLSKASYVSDRGVFRLFNIAYCSVSVTGVILFFAKDVMRRMVYVVIYNALGCWYQFPFIYGMQPFSYFHSFVRYLVLFNFSYWPRLIKDCNIYKKVCFISDNSQVLYIRSVGSWGLVILPIFFNSWSLILLPSGQLKCFGKFAYVTCGLIGFREFKNLNLWHAGKRKLLGYKTTVRGTVKNANDHPNGGRTRSLLCSRTPWGRVAKRSKKQQFELELE